MLKFDRYLFTVKSYALLPPMSPILNPRSWTITIYHKCEGGVEKSVKRITELQYEVCRVMRNGDREGRFFLSHPHTNNGLFFLSHH